MLKSSTSSYNFGSFQSIQLQTEITDTNLIIYSNEHHIQQILRILILNAIEAMENTSGFINIRLCKQNQIDPLYDQIFPSDFHSFAASFAMIKIEDQGEGIIAENLPRLCDPFFSTRSVGRGMGLSVLLGFIKGQNGCLTVSSQIQKGSTFRLYIPLN